MADSSQDKLPHDPSPLRKAAVAVVRRLVDAGFVAYFAGGCVRDRLMGLEPKDYDVATDARPEQVLELFRRAQAVGESFGVVLVRSASHTMEVATFRTDGTYSDRRHPDQVTFSDAEHDARRRDFTINGLFEDPLGQRIIDYVNGQQDIAARVIRAIGDPARRLREDHLRMLRAVRFAARFQFSIEADTEQAIRAEVSELAGISRERIGQEIKLMFTDANRSVAAWTMQYLGLDEAVLEEAQLVVAPTRLGRLPAGAAYPTALAAWLLDRHGSTGGGEARKIAARWARSLMLSNAEARALRRCVEVHRTLLDRWGQLGVAAQKRLAAGEAFSAALMIVLAEDRPAFLEIQRRVAELAETGLAPPPLITGDDLIAEEVTPGPSFKRILDAVYDAQLEGSIGTRAEAMALARAILAGG